MNDKTPFSLVNRPYATPVIQEFGNIREITQSIAGNTGQDGGNVNATKHFSRTV